MPALVCSELSSDVNRSPGVPCRLGSSTRGRASVTGGGATAILGPPSIGVSDGADGAGGNERLFTTTAVRSEDTGDADSWVVPGSCAVAGGVDPTNVREAVRACGGLLRRSAG